MNFVKNPYLPEKRVIAGVGDVKIEKVKSVKPFLANCLTEGLMTHADLTFCYLGDGKAVVAPEAFDYYVKQFENTDLEITKGEKYLDRHYPHDASYNVAIVGNKMFCKKDITDCVLLEKAEEKGYEIIDIKQGYSKCSICPIDENSAISADVGFYKKAQKVGMEVLLITNESINLKGYNNGFFGGSAFMIDKKTLFVNGDLTTHPDFEKIADFLEKRGICAIWEKNGEKLYDIGSFVPVFEV